MLIKPILNPIVRKALSPLIGGDLTPSIPPIPPNITEPFTPISSLFADFTNDNLSQTSYITFENGINGEASAAKDAGWTVATKTVNLGQAAHNVQALKAKQIFSSQVTYFEMVLDFADARDNLVIEYLASSETNYDKFVVYKDLAVAPDGSSYPNLLTASGTMSDFTSKTFTIPEGKHKITFAYMKDRSASKYDDTVYIKSIVYKKAKEASIPVTRTIDFSDKMPIEFYQAGTLGWNITGTKVLRAPILKDGLTKTSFDVMLNFADRTELGVEYLINSAPYGSKFSVYIDGNKLFEDSGQGSVYKTSSNIIDGGLHKVTFEYDANTANASPEDTVYIKSISYTNEQSIQVLNDKVGVYASGIPYINSDRQYTLAPKDTLALDYSKGSQFLLVPPSPAVIPHFKQIPLSYKFSRSVEGVSDRNGILSIADINSAEQFVDGDYKTIKVTNAGRIAGGNDSVSNARLQNMKVKRRIKNKLDPFLTLTATKFTETDINANHTVQFPLTVFFENNQRYYVSLLASPIGRSLGVYLDIDSRGPVAAIFNTETLHITNTDNTRIFNTKITPLAEGWFNLYAEFIKYGKDPFNTLVRVDSHIGTQAIFQGDESKGFYVDGLQTGAVEDLDYVKRYGVRSFRQELATPDYNPMDVLVTYFNDTSDILPKENVHTNYFPSLRSSWVKSIDLQTYIPYKRNLMKFLPTTQVKFPRVGFAADFGIKIVLMYRANPGHELRVFSLTTPHTELKMIISDNKVTFKIGSLVSISHNISGSNTLRSIRYGRTGKEYYLELDGDRTTYTSTSSSAEPICYMDSFGQEYGGSSSFNDIIFMFDIESGGKVQNDSVDLAYLFDQSQQEGAVINANADAQRSLINPSQNFPGVGEWYSLRNFSSVTEVSNVIRNTMNQDASLIGVGIKLTGLEITKEYLVKVRVTHGLTQGNLQMVVTNDNTLSTIPNDSCNLRTVSYTNKNIIVSEVFKAVAGTMYFGILLHSGKVGQNYDINYAIITPSSNAGTIVKPGESNEYQLQNDGAWKIEPST